jgi:hypothetical protein
MIFNLNKMRVKVGGWIFLVNGKSKLMEFQPYFDADVLVFGLYQHCFNTINNWKRNRHWFSVQKWCDMQLDNLYLVVPIGVCCRFYELPIICVDLINDSKKAFHDYFSMGSQI